MSAAEELRRAAAIIRHDAAFAAPVAPEAFLAAIADWFDAEADKLQPVSFLHPPTVDPPKPVSVYDPPAIAAARAFLQGDPT